MNSKSNVLPAVALGGPPHSGKSVLAHSLSQALRWRDVPHYVLRAYPDGEGDWSFQAERELVRELRVKGAGTPEWTRRIVRDIAGRPLPLIVDPGGKPTAWQEAIFAACTHGILLCPDEGAHAEWLERFHAHGLVLIADLWSELRGRNHLEALNGVLRGTLAGLEHHSNAAGPAFEQLVEWLARLFAYSATELRALHLKQAPTEIVIQLNRLGRTLGALDAQQQWIPTELPRVLGYLPPSQAFAVYERGPNWLYAALARHAFPNPFYQFDARLGWLKPSSLQRGDSDGTGLLRWIQRETAEHVSLEFSLADPYLDYLDSDGLVVPEIGANRGLILDGRLPHWLLTGLARAYHDVKWLAVYQPQLGAHAPVIHSNNSRVKIGSLVPYRPSTDQTKMRPNI